MKSYEQAVALIANDVVNDEMGGGYGQIKNAYMVAFIFEKTEEQVFIDVHVQMGIIKKMIYESFLQHKQSKINT